MTAVDETWSGSRGIRWLSSIRTPARMTTVGIEGIIVRTVRRRRGSGRRAYIHDDDLRTSRADEKRKLERRTTRATASLDSQKERRWSSDGDGEPFTAKVPMFVRLSTTTTTSFSSSNNLNYTYLPKGSNSKLKRCLLAETNKVQWLLPPLARLFFTITHSTCLTRGLDEFCCLLLVTQPEHIHSMLVVSLALARFNASIRCIKEECSRIFIYAAFPTCLSLCDGLPVFATMIKPGIHKYSLSGLPQKKLHVHTEGNFNNTPIKLHATECFEYSRNFGP